jgi:L-fuculose-phosphate aldolase
MKIVREIIKYGKLIEKYNLISSHAGNISVRDESHIYVTKTKTMLGHLNDNDIIKIALFDNDSAMKYASMETLVHKAIYKNSNTKAIIHTHPVYAITLSLVSDIFIPVDSEGKYLLDKVPILKVKKSIASEEVAEKIPALFKKYKAVIVQGHGVFAAADSLEKAFYISTVLETSSKIYYKTKLWISKVF